MGDGEQADDFGSQIDLETLFDNIPDNMNLFLEDQPLVTESSVEDLGLENLNSSPNSVSSWFGEIEQLLMDDKEPTLENQGEFFEDFLSDLFDASVDHQSCEARVSNDDGSNPESNVSSDDNEEKEKNDVSEVKKGEGEDPLTKKRKRQLRNRDAALRSRERKKMYVRDLELKSRYLEGECKRLNRLLQCFIAENQTLHLRLQKDNALGASMAKQESAVLLMESLLLGSLLWFLGIMCLFSLPRLLHSNLAAATLENAGNNNRESLVLRGAGNKRLGLGVLRLFFKSKRCKATRKKMRTSSLYFSVLV